MERLRSCIAGNDKVRVVAESLEASVPDISMNIIVGARRTPEKCDVPQSSHREPDDNESSRKSWRTEKFTDREQVHDACNSQGRHEGWSTPVAEGARANRQGHKQDGAESVELR